MLNPGPIVTEDDSAVVDKEPHHLPGPGAGPRGPSFQGQGVPVRPHDCGQQRPCGRLVGI